MDNNRNKVMNKSKGKQQDAKNDNKRAPMKVVPSRKLFNMQVPRYKVSPHFNQSFDIGSNKLSARLAQRMKRVEEPGINVNTLAGTTANDGELRHDQGMFTMEQSRLMTSDNYQTLDGTSYSLLFVLPMTFRRTVQGTIYEDVRGNLVDIKEYSVTFHNMSKDNITVYGNSPRADVNNPGNIVARLYERIINLSGGQTTTVTMQFGSQFGQAVPLVGNVIDPLDASSTLKIPVVRMFDFYAVTSNTESGSGTAYEAVTEQLKVSVNVKYVTSRVGNTAVDGITVAKRDSDTILLQSLGDVLASVQIDPKLLTRTQLGDAQSQSLNEYMEETGGYKIQAGLDRPIYNGPARLRPRKYRNNLTFAISPRNNNQNKGFLDTVLSAVATIEKVIGVVSLVAGYF